MKKIIALVLSLVMLVSVFAGCTQKEVQQEADGLKVCMVIYGGSLGDQAFCDGIYNGLEKFTKEKGYELNHVEVAEASDIEMTTRTMAAEGYNVFVYQDPSASDQMDTLCVDLPDCTFLIFNGTNATGHKNLTNLCPDTANAAFLSGIFGTLMNEEICGEKKCGYIGGVRSPFLERTRYAMQAAAELLGGNLHSAYVGSFNDAATAKEITQQMQSEGVHVVQAWCGGGNKGVFEAAEAAGEGYFSLGAATGQFHMSETIVASLAINMDVMMYDVMEKVDAGTMESGFFAPGIENGIVDCVYAPDQRADQIPASVSKTLDEYRQKIISGELKVPTTEDEYKQFASEYLG